MSAAADEIHAMDSKPMESMEALREPVRGNGLASSQFCWSSMDSTNARTACFWNP
jgi:hypothetical protein